MTAPDTTGTIGHVAARLAAEHRTLATRWLARLEALLPVEANSVFPSHQLLDHIPSLILEIAEYVRAPEGEEIAANTGVLTRASELGWLRFDQRASVHQLLREFQVLAEILELFFEEETARLGARADAPAAIRAVSRMNQAVRVLAQKTVDAFVTRYVETVEQTTKQLRSFGRLVSHEIRQPLGVLHVAAKLLPVPPDNPEAVRLAGVLQRNVGRLAEMCTKLEQLALVNGHDGDLPTEQLVDLTAVARDVARQLVDMSDARQVTVHVEEGLPTLATDMARVELTLVNLLANAIKYSDPAKSDRTVHVERAAQAGLGIQVRDNGIGIPPSEEIFDQFVRLETSLDDDMAPRGMGLGLSIVRECMQAMRGTVRVESREGVGTIFVLEWPADVFRDQPA